MKISILVPQSRVGGLDVLFNSLDRQTHKDFELILMDAVYERRAEMVRQHAECVPYRVVHLPPYENPFPWANYCRSLNVGIAHARGEIALYLPDYTWLDADCLAVHDEFHERQRAAGNPKVGLMLDYSYLKLPALRDTFPTPGYGPGAENVVHGSDPVGYDVCQDKAADRYAEDVRTGRLDDCLWTIFKEGLTEDWEVKELAVTLRHHKNDWEALQDVNYCSLKNESVPLDGLVAINGHDEDFDLSHGWQDSELCWRLVNGYGMQWWSRPGGEIRVVDPRPVLYYRKQHEKTNFNGELLAAKKLNPHDNNGWPEPARHRGECLGEGLRANRRFDLREIRKWTVPELTR